jgi:hypothetical protein
VLLVNLVVVIQIEAEIDTDGECMQRHFDFVLLGGGPASVSAAETLRAEGTKGNIQLVSEEDCVPYEYRPRG